MQIQIRPPANEAPVGDFTSIGFGLSIQQQYGAAPKVVQKRPSCKILKMIYFQVMIKSLIEICEAELLLFDRQGCISCGILVSGIRARGVSSELMENMEMFSCSPT